MANPLEIFLVVVCAINFAYDWQNHQEFALWIVDDNFEPESKGSHKAALYIMPAVLILSILSLVAVYVASPETDAEEAAIDIAPGRDPEARERKKSAVLLFVGSVSGLFAFLSAGALGFDEYLAELQTNTRGYKFASGNNYFPHTVSELVHNKDDPIGQCFFAFAMIGAICMLMSWYPFNLRNAWAGDDRGVLVSWSTHRQFLPPLGMILVACLPAPPAIQTTKHQKICVLIHTFGAVGMIGGYFVIEVITLLSISKRLSSREANIRWTLMFWLFISAIIFQVSSVVVQQHTNGTWDYFCCWDDWHVPSKEDLVAAKFPNKRAMELAMLTNRRLLFNTAYGAGLAFKYLSYYFEVLAGLYMIASHLTVWAFSQERKLDLKEHLDKLSNMQ